MATLDPDWFAMEDLIRRPLGAASWIVLRQLEVIKREREYAEVIVAAELFRDRDDGRPIRFQIRSEFLRDFLTARGRVVAITSYISRRAVFAVPPKSSWMSEETRAVNGGLWQGYIRAVHPNGMPYGEKVHVVRLFRNDVDKAGDAPTVDMFDGNVESEQFDHGYQGGPYYFVEGELRRSQWFRPGTLSVRVRGDREPLDGTSYRVAAEDRRCRPGARSAARLLRTLICAYGGAE